MHLFPDFHNGIRSCDLFAVDAKPLTQAGEMDLTLSFDTLPNNKFVHTFILADISHPILGLDFLHNNHIIIDTHSYTVSLGEPSTSFTQIPPLPNVDLDKLSLLDILALYPNLISGELHVNKKVHPFEHSIDVEGPPITFRPRRLSPEKTRELNRQLDEMLRLNIIRSSTSPWASPVHLVKKKDDSYRLVIDYRAINKNTRKMNYPLPRIQDFTANVHGCTIFSCLDLKSAFWQLDVKAGDRKYTCFSTHRGNFEFNKMPFGLTYASSSFQHFINHVLRGTESFCFSFIDDIFIFSQDLKQHKAHLLDIANRLDAYGLTLNMSKTSLAQSEIEVLGYQLSPKGILPLQNKVTAIEKFPLPTTVKSLRQFLGMVTYQRRFLKNAAGLLQPLNDLLQGKVRNTDLINWTDSAKAAFLDTKMALQNITTLAHPDDKAELQLKCDASGVAVGAILEQSRDGKVETLGYFSKALHGPQTRYSTYDLELLSVYLSVKYFEHLLYDRHFVIYTDHKSLVNSFNKPSETHSPRQVRHLSYLTQFNCDILHLPGKDNVTADCLSRVVIEHVLQRDQLPFSAVDIALEQRKYPALLDFPPDSSIFVSEEPISDCDLSLFVDVSKGFPRPIIPPSMQDKLIWHYHNLAHTGIKATQKCIQQRYVFYNMHKQIRDLVKSCIACQRSKTTRHVKSPIHPIPMPSSRFDSIHADICGPFPPSQGNCYLLVCVDRFTRWVEAYPMSDQSTESVITAFGKHLQTFGTCSSLHTDSGCQFTSSTFKEYCKFLGVQHHLSNIRYPQSNGLCERYIKTIKTALTAKLDRNHWTRYVPLIILSINNMYKEDLKSSSAELVFGQTLRLPGDLCYDTPKPRVSYPSDMLLAMRKFANACKPTDTRVAPLTSEHMPHILQNCTHIYIRNDPIKANLTPTYDGPFFVVSRTNKTFHVLRNNTLYAVAINNVKPAFSLPSPVSATFDFPFMPTAPSHVPSSHTTTHHTHDYNLRHAPRPTIFPDFVMS